MVTHLYDDHDELGPGAVGGLRSAIAARAAQLVRDEGLDFGAAKRKAARQLQADRHGACLPSTEEIDAALHLLAIEDAGSAEVEATLAALRRAALTVMRRLSAYQPHLSGAVWRGTAGAHSPIDIDLYTDDDKQLEIDLANAGINFDVEAPSRGSVPRPQRLLFDAAAPPPLQFASFRLAVHPAQAERGALRAMVNGRSLRGRLDQLERLLADDAR
jgi:hypothetical protein